MRSQLSQTMRRTTCSRVDGRSPLDLGDTFIPRYTKREGHLHVVVTIPDDDGQIAVVNLTTLRAGSDTCCIVRSKEHAWVRHDSVALYSQARLVDGELMERALTQGAAFSHEAVGDSLLDRIQRSALRCDQTPPLVVEAIESTLAARILSMTVTDLRPR